MSQDRVRLRREIYRDDIEKLIEWLENEVVSEYLNELPFIDNALKDLLRNNSCEVFTHYVNHRGHFYMIDLEEDGTIGYARLNHYNDQGEVIIAIGDTSQWGKGFGKAALWKLMKTAFFKYRLTHLFAKIHSNNERSKAVFEKMGFEFKREQENEEIYAISQESFLNFIS